ncbi:hypothetical protein STRIP9103_05060 [Streptomyces ipomoeae 91-03]|uniref:Uncharacterized protein n=1 Tax=Streptomyces ipomoeae 91-03 TaxID=698759 RepID=L1L964_9ACTN|nr:hypothetical protein STRIP9103_05060 [Streptomyces ipomoeae 91-03]
MHPVASGGSAPGAHGDRHIRLHGSTVRTTAVRLAACRPAGRTPGRPGRGPRASASGHGGQSSGQPTQYRSARRTVRHLRSSPKELGGCTTLPQASPARPAALSPGWGAGPAIPSGSDTGEHSPPAA